MSGLADRLYCAIVRLLPDAVTARVLPGLIRQFHEVGVTTIPAAKTRLLIGPANSAGQAYAWARAAERIPGVTARAVTFRGDDDVFGFRADHVVPSAALVGNARWRAAQRRAVFKGFTHVILESATHLYDPDASVAHLINDLQSRDIRVALLWHGSDIRVPSSHVKRERDSPFAGSYPDSAVLERIARRNQELARQARVPMFVSTPDLLADVPNARWLPVVVDVARPPAPRSAGAPPLVLHAPSRAGIKGTERIEHAVRRLEAEGVIRYEEARRVSSASMPARYARADIVLDQFLIGSYGVAACEAMAAGCVVVGHVDDFVRGIVRQQADVELPIVQARAADIEQVLRRLTSQPGELRRYSTEGMDFVSRVHGGAMSARVLQDFLSARVLI